jgi:spermidine synthase
MWVELARAVTPDGGELVLRSDGIIHEIRVNGWELMSNRATRSEAALAELGCAGLTGAPSVLLGGLGLGYTLRSALDILPAAAAVTVVELLPAIAAWNRGVVGPLAGRPLDDPRVQLRLGNVGAALVRGEGVWDAILLDIDNGPQALTDRGNDAIYRAAGLQQIRRALKPGGACAVWSADPAPDFERRLEAAGFAVKSTQVSPRGAGEGPMHTILVGRAPGNPRSP